MNFWIGVQEGLREIAAHRFRSFLTMFGVILGVGSLMTMFGLTEGMAREFRFTLEQVGGLEKVDLIDAPAPPEQLDFADTSPGRTYADAIALRQVPLIDLVSPQVRVDGQATRGNKSANVGFTGGEPDFLEIERHTIGEGRFITPLDVQQVHRVCVIGRSLVDELWETPPPSALGQVLQLSGEPFTIVGVFTLYVSGDQRRMKARGLVRQQEARRKSRGGRNSRNRWDLLWGKNHTVVIPITTAQALFKSAQVQNGTDLGPDLKLTFLSARIKDLSRFNTAIEQMRNVITLTHRGIQDFGFNTREDWFDNIERSIRSQRLSGGFIAGISLLVGGLGIANIMLASIAERVREIGIRRALGARASAIFLQIVLESTVLAALGGLLGIGAGFGLMALVQSFNPDAQPPVVVPSALVISFSFALATGLLAGLFPAWKASRLSPIQALRYE